jgi:hypothetical protein
MKLLQLSQFGSAVDEEDVVLDDSLGGRAEVESGSSSEKRFRPIQELDRQRDVQLLQAQKQIAGNLIELNGFIRQLRIS